MHWKRDLDILYILFGHVLTGVAHHSEFATAGKEASVSYVIKTYMSGYEWLGTGVTLAILAGFSSVILVMLMGQSRVFFSMSKDGLMPKVFSEVHPKFGTPAFATIITGIFVGVPALFMSISRMTDLTSIGTLFAFVLVCFGVLVLPRLSPDVKKKSFQLPYINGQFIIPGLAAIFIYFGLDRISSAFAAIQTEGYQEFLYLIFVLYVFSLYDGFVS